MNILVLVEGKDDYIILSYYLRKKYGFKYRTSDFEIYNCEDNQTISLYTKNDLKLYCLSVGGKNNFSNIYNKYIYEKQFNDNYFDYIYLFRDKDDDSYEQIRSTLGDIIQKWDNGRVIKKSYVDCYKRDRTVNICINIIPDESNGELEDVLIEAIRMMSDKHDIMVNETTKYAELLKRNELFVTKKIQKSILAICIAVMNPEKTFATNDRFLTSVDWENSNIIYELYKPLLVVLENA